MMLSCPTPLLLAHPLSSCPCNIPRPCKVDCGIISSHHVSILVVTTLHNTIPSRPRQNPHHGWPSQWKSLSSLLRINAESPHVRIFIISFLSSRIPCPIKLIVLNAESSRSLSNDCCIIIGIFTQSFGTSLLPRCPRWVEPISLSHLQCRSLWFRRLFIIVLIDDSLRGLEAVAYQPTTSLQ